MVAGTAPQGSMGSIVFNPDTPIPPPKLVSISGSQRADKPDELLDTLFSNGKGLLECWNEQNELEDPMMGLIAVHWAKEVD